MGTLNFAGGASLSGSGSNLTSTSGVDFSGNLNFGGNWIDAPIGTIIKRGSYNTGYGNGARLATAVTSWSVINVNGTEQAGLGICLLYTSPSPRDRQKSRMPSSA